MLTEKQEEELSPYLIGMADAIVYEMTKGGNWVHVRNWTPKFLSVCDKVVKRGASEGLLKTINFWKEERVAAKQAMIDALATALERLETIIKEKK